MPPGTLGGMFRSALTVLTALLIGSAAAQATATPPPPDARNATFNWTSRTSAPPAPTHSTPTVT